MYGLIFDNRRRYFLWTYELYTYTRHLEISNIYFTFEKRLNFEYFEYLFYFRETFKFRDFMKTLRNFAKPVFACSFAKFKYLGNNLH